MINFSHAGNVCAVPPDYKEIKNVRMKLLLDIKISEPEVKIDYRDKILLVGSCFTEHIGDSLADLKFQVMQNPNGIVFDPSTVASSITSYIENKKYSPADLVQLNELWQSWQHHSRYSGVNRDEVLNTINKLPAGST
jgi:hypothetical protein